MPSSWLELSMHTSRRTQMLSPTFLLNRHDGIRQADQLRLRYIRCIYIPELENQTNISLTSAAKSTVKLLTPDPKSSTTQMIAYDKSELPVARSPKILRVLDISIAFHKHRDHVSTGVSKINNILKAPEGTS